MAIARENLDTDSLDDGGLGARSVEILLAGQAPSGALIASPTFPIYQFAWLRDGSFCARALDAAGRTGAAERFHRWVEQTLATHRGQAEQLIAALDAGHVPPAADMLPARYALDGRLEVPGAVKGEVWPNYQVDGYGSWLFELASHVERGGSAAFDRDAVDLAARYIAAAWRADCYDCWEEFGDGQHASTLAAVAAGLDGAARLLDAPAYAEQAATVRESLRTRFVRDGLVRKGAADDRLDASLLWLAVPYRILEPSDPIMCATAEAIRADLRGRTGGIHRYLGDTYYGGGEWILLTCWLGWYDAVTGNRPGFDAARDWVRKQTTPLLDLPEQSSDGAQEPQMIEPWVLRWGPVATPLLWSHAMYLLMLEAALPWT